MPTQKDCKYSQLSQLSQISGQIAFDKIYEYGRVGKSGTLLFRNILKHGDEELPGLGDRGDVHTLVR